MIVQRLFADAARRIANAPTPIADRLQELGIIGEDGCISDAVINLAERLITLENGIAALQELLMAERLERVAGYERSIASPVPGEGPVLSVRQMPEGIVATRSPDGIRPAVAWIARPGSTAWERLESECFIGRFPIES